MLQERMSVKHVFRWFRESFNKWYEPDEGTGVLLKSLAAADQGTISCEDIVMVLHRFEDAIGRGENVLLFMPLIKQHLDVCPACKDEYERLLRKLQPKIDI